MLFVGNIVAVNGMPPRGLWTSRQFLMNFSPAPQPGLAIADVSRGSLAGCKWEFLDADGQFAGALMGDGYLPHAVVGGVGAFYGIKGQMTGGTPSESATDSLSVMSEDPGRRRSLGGRTSPIIFHLLPASRPEGLRSLTATFATVCERRPFGGSQLTG